MGAVELLVFLWYKDTVAPFNPAIPCTPSVFLAKIVGSEYVTATLVSDGDPLTRAVHEYTVSPLFVTLGGLAFQSVLPIVRAEVAKLKNDSEVVGLVGDAPLLATLSEYILISET